MSTRYVVINLDDEKEYIITNTIRSLSEYLNDMYLINKSHMYYHRVFKDNDKLIMERLIIYKLLL
jgi:hypothetical protein